jgi:hypothetical protein
MWWYHLGNNGTNWGNQKLVNEGAKVDKFVHEGIFFDIPY